ncbi:HAD family hydrolase [Anaerobacillus alkaliphilus]|uniref:HAD family hydrolase n=1 Tax=Anaerobacillus alkaliphilus TaxID=1548597 RepID=A0A4Q0VXB3_9BACI|nr:HAD family hydrolase [Anaerobacillus alkaliphilus]RXJ04387.1 HAD family hydrolase [Anaerobacillus alkaliphilus]
MYKVILFDLDGTLTDPKLGITKCVEYSLAKLGISEPNLDMLEKFIGPPLQESFAKIYGFDIETTNRAIEYYRERFREKGMYENEVYSGISSLLASLKNQEKIVVVATSKPTVFAEKILQHFCLDQYFDLIVGSNLDGTRTSKTDVIQYILEEYPEFEKHQFLMIGDREHDIIGANNTRIDSIAVTYGYGTFAELEVVKPTCIVKDVEELREKLTFECISG